MIAYYYIGLCVCADGLLIKTRKFWCIVKDGIFYGYEKQTSKSQHFSFPLKGSCMLNVNFELCRMKEAFCMRLGEEEDPHNNFNTNVFRLRFVHKLWVYTASDSRHKREQCPFPQLIEGRNERMSLAMVGDKKDTRPQSLCVNYHPSRSTPLPSPVSIRLSEKDMMVCCQIGCIARRVKGDRLNPVSPRGCPLNRRVTRVNDL